MKRVLVTGASGFIGRQTLAPLIALGFEVHAVARRPLPPSETPGITWHAADLLDQDPRRSLMRTVQPTHLLHLAWTTEHGRFWTAPDNLDWVAATLDLARRLQELGGERIVAAGSCAEYDPPPDGPCVETETPTRPKWLYGVAKHACHQALSAFATTCGLSLAWGRLFFVYGPHEPPGRLAPRVIRGLLAVKPTDCGPGDQTRDFMDSRDAGAAFAALLASAVEGPVNVSSGQPIKVAELIMEIGRQCGRTDLIRLGALPSRPYDPPNLVGDTHRLRDEVGFVPRFELRQGIANATEWWRKQLSVGCA